jgi:hypothetical protein
MKNLTKNYDWINYSFGRNERKQQEKHISRIVFFFIVVVHMMAVYAVLGG